MSDHYRIAPTNGARLAFACGTSGRPCCHGDDPAKFCSRCKEAHVLEEARRFRAEVGCYTAAMAARGLGPVEAVTVDGVVAGWSTALLRRHRSGGKR